MSKIREAKARALAELEGYTLRTASGILKALLEIPGVGATRALEALRELEADGEIVVDRKNGRAVGYRGVQGGVIGS